MSCLPNVRSSSKRVARAHPRSREHIEAELGIIQPETWPPRYKFHKYWGRKPSNVVSRYIEFFSDPAELVLDPFCGSGVTVIESARLGRRSLGMDINPIAVRLTNAMLCPANAELFKQEAQKVIEAARSVVGEAFSTDCDGCGKLVEVRSFGYVRDVLQEVRFSCRSCGFRGARHPTGRDIRRSHIKFGELLGPDADISFGWEMQKLKRKGVTRWNELFTHRNQHCAAALRSAILRVEDPHCREWLLVTLTAALAQFTRMMMDSSGASGGPSWKINCYWLPEKWQELNPLVYFANRVKKSIHALNDLGQIAFDSKVIQGDSREIPLDDNSVHYLFTDPPYGGEGIQYGELSTLWNLWLGEESQLSKEIAYNPFRGFDQAHYAAGLAKVFGECFRVLGVRRHMTVTFANKDSEVWNSLMDACRSAGFNLLTAVPMKRSAPSLTETNMERAPKSDLVLTFVKPPPGRSGRPSKKQYSLDTAVARLISHANSNGKSLTARELFDQVTIDWFTWYYENGLRERAVKPSLQNVTAAMLSLNPDQGV